MTTNLFFRKKYPVNTAAPEHTAAVRIMAQNAAFETPAIKPLPPSVRNGKYQVKQQLLRCSNIIKSAF